MRPGEVGHRRHVERGGVELLRLYQAGDINNPPLGISDYDVRHRISFSASIPIPLWHDLRSQASFFYNGQSGRPYSIVFNNDVNGDSRTTNDLIFIPATADQVNVINGTWAQLDAFLNADDATKDFRGKIAPRNTGRAPWTNSLNFRYGVDIPTAGKTKIQATMDIFNLLNPHQRQEGLGVLPELRRAHDHRRDGRRRRTSTPIT